MNILVTGASRPQGQTLVKALNLSEMNYRLFTADARRWGAALFVGERGVVIPDVADDEGSWLDAIIDICKKSDIDAILPGDPREVPVFAREAGAIQRNSRARALVADPETTATCYDRLRAAEFLREAGVGFPITAAADDAQAVDEMAADLGWPLVARPRVPASGGGLTLAHSRAELDKLLRDPQGLIVQEYLANIDGEYTVGVVLDRAGNVAGSIGMKRVLEHGVTVAALVDRFALVQDYAEDIARRLRPQGVCNVQLRLTERGPVCFEINPRFSSTEAQRAHYGFNAVEAVIREFVLGEAMPDLKNYRSGFFARYLDEIYVPLDEWLEISETGEIGLSTAKAFPALMRGQVKKNDDDDDDGMTSFPYHLQGS